MADDAWQANLAALRAYANEHGALPPPPREGPGLRGWLVALRQRDPLAMARLLRGAPPPLEAPRTPER